MMEGDRRVARPLRAPLLVAGLTLLAVVSVALLPWTTERGLAAPQAPTPQLLGCLGDFVWLDADGDGLQAPTEPGVDGIVVDLLDETMNTVASTTTDGDGRYRFFDIAPGPHFVRFVATDGLGFTAQTAGVDPTLDSDPDPASGLTAAVVVGEGAVVRSVDAGLVGPTPAPPQGAALGDVVWNDRNGNGLRDECEPGMAGVAVDLLDDTLTRLDTTQTDDDGRYEFTGLAAGTYSVRFTSPAGFRFAPASAGADPTADSNPDPATGVTDPITLAEGDVDRSADAGLVPLGGVIQIEKSALVPIADSTASFSLSVVNAGSVDLFDVVISDPLTPDCDASIGTLLVGQGVAYDCSVAADTNFVNVATATAFDGLGNEVTDVDSAESDIVSTPAVEPVTPDTSTPPTTAVPETPAVTPTSEPPPTAPPSSAVDSAGAQAALARRQRMEAIADSITPGSLELRQPRCSLAPPIGNRDVPHLEVECEGIVAEAFALDLVVSRKAPPPDPDAAQPPEDPPDAAPIALGTAFTMRAELLFDPARVEVGGSGVDVDGQSAVLVKNAIEDEQISFTFRVTPLEPGASEMNLSLRAQDDEDPSIQRELATGSVSLVVTEPQQTPAPPTSSPPTSSPPTASPATTPPPSEPVGSSLLPWILGAATLVLGGGALGARRLKAATIEPAPAPAPVVAAAPVAPAASNRIFVSYRRAESAEVVDRILDRLDEEFGEGNVFRDIESIELGEDFHEAIFDAVGSAKILLAVIGPEWLTIEDDKGNRRVDSPTDFPRLELEAAFDRNIRVIPLYVRGAAPPSEDELPPSLQRLANKNGLPIRPDPDFDNDMHRLTEAMRRADDPTSSP